MKKLLLLSALFLMTNTPIGVQAISESDLSAIEESAGYTFEGASVHEETGILLIDIDLNTIMSNQKGIEYFSDDIHMFFNKDDMPYMPNGVAFRGYAEMSGDSVAMAVYYYNEENANRDWSEVHILSTDMYKLADYKSVVSPFSQYLDGYTTQDIDEDDPIDNALMRMTLMPKPKQ